MTLWRTKALTFSVIVIASCRPAPPRGAPEPAIPIIPPAALPAPNPKLPPVPEVRGPIQISVTYPRSGQLISARDSNFIFGSVGSGDAGLRINGAPVPVWPNGAFMGWLAVPPDSAPHYEIVASNGIQFARLVHRIKLPSPVAPPESPDTLTGDTLDRVPPPVDTIPPDTITNLPRNVYAAVGTHVSAVSDTDRVSIARPAPGSGQVYKWFLLPRTVVKVTGYRIGNDGEYARIELDSAQEAWLPKSELSDTLDSIPPTRRLGTVRVEPTAEWIDLVIPMSSPPPFLAEESERGISLLLYGVSGATVVSMMPAPADPYLASISSTPEPSRVRYSINLNQPPYGYLALWINGEFRFRIRRPPNITDSNSPLRGLTITVDPGHPPAGATGPTGFYEADAVLEVGLKLRDLLAAKGANVVMTRTTADPVELGLRPIISRRANAHAFVSIHLNALPDGVNPFTDRRVGTTTYYFWPHSRLLGQSTQPAMVDELGLGDVGTLFGNYAVIRGTWMPSILAEGAFIILPDQEAALKTPVYQQAYANAIMQGLESYFVSFVRTP
ncbi:MAG TPA: N-acetylmuramoyl-L-alanine amidase [Gemmatimonadaceae bacterium]|nr:N-acetylmuramoyl-L-alanine amidase [Gemmatimonadaceae bacterium]